jgi:hypothetical protein
VESVEFEEDHDVNGGKEPCLVVRLRHPVNDPVVVRLAGTGVSPVGYEERLYRMANKYTAVFWPVRRSQAAQIALELISLKDFKENRSYSYATKIDLPAPNRADDKPDPVQVRTNGGPDRSRSGGN